MRKSGASPPVVSLREEQKRLTRRRLVDAALQVFEETGFRAASIDQIAKRAGANRSTFYLHFKSKADLGHAMAGRVRKPFLNLYRRLDKLRGAPRREIRLWIDAYVSFWDQHCVINEVLSEGMLTDRELAHIGLVNYQRLTGSLKTLLGSFPNGEREGVRARLFLMQQMLDAAIVRHMVPGSRGLPEALREGATDLFAILLARPAKTPRKPR